MARPKLAKYNVKDMIEKLTKYIESEDIPILEKVYAENKWTRQRVQQLSQENPELFDTIKWGITKKIAGLEEKMINNTGNVTGLIFALKQLGFSDNPQIVNNYAPQLKADKVEVENVTLEQMDRIDDILNESK